MNHDALLRIAEDAVRDTGRLIRSLSQSERGVAGTEIGGREVKLHADQRAHEHLSRILSRTGLPILSEEDKESHTKSLDAIWVIDPLDGSYNFTRGLGHSMVSCAYVEAGQPVIGALFDVSTEDVFVGGADHPSRMNGMPIRCSDATALSAAVLCTGFPARFSFTGGAGTDSYFAFMSGFAKVRMLGSAAHSICLTARGAADCYAERSIMFWDVAAGIAVSQGAGARLLTPNQFSLEPLSVILAPPSLIEPVTQLADRSRAFPRH
ncbi:MAG: inositol monophosphatase family protein [Actinomycetota bacterium]